MEKRIDGMSSLSPHVLSGEERSHTIGAHLKAGALAGLAGGAAEVIFMAFYCALIGKSGIEMLRLVAYTFFDGGDQLWLSGLCIHLGLSLLIGLVFGLVVYSAERIGITARYPVIAISGVLMLVGIWAFNFFVLLPLPWVNPEFAAFVPITTAFFSKLSFGVTLGLYRPLLRPSYAGKPVLSAMRAAQTAG